MYYSCPENLQYAALDILDDRDLKPLDTMYRVRFWQHFVHIRIVRCCSEQLKVV